VSNKASESERVNSLTLEEREDAEKPEYNQAIPRIHRGRPRSKEERQEK
jgi:hypothetical protein